MWYAKRLQEAAEISESSFRDSNKMQKQQRNVQDYSYFAESANSQLILDWLQDWHRTVCI
jgi:hypothetical protein